MRQFLTPNDNAFLDLEERARWSCLRFQAQELPPGCTPDRADIAFEIDSDQGLAKLLVARGVSYNGQSQDVREWVDNGKIEFPAFAALIQWIQGPLKQAFNQQTTSPTLPEQSPLHLSGQSGRLTDLRAVQEGMRDLDQPLYMDEEHFLSQLHGRIIGQDHALQTLAAVMVRHLARRHPARPAVLFSVGPSGVGKTRTAEIMAQILSNIEDRGNGYQYLRLDMNEYQESHRISQLLGSPQGYIGHGDGSQFISTLRANPRTIVLFDEIEKAHPSILRALMNAMDAGRLSSASSSTGEWDIDCSLAVFIFTSNLDAKTILEELENRAAFGDRATEDEVCRRRLHATGIAPEIVGRIGSFLVYQPLSQETRAEIMAISIKEVAEEYGVQVAYIEPGVIIELMQKVRSINFGVRPERALIDQLLGSAFIKVSQQGGTEPVAIAGPPFECKPYQL
ncbi:MAG: AAA family ATPase [Pseudomonadota bacterium]